MVFKMSRDQGRPIHQEVFLLNTDVWYNQMKFISQ